MTDWKFDVEDVGPEAEEDDDDSTDQIGPPVEPERPAIEHVIPFLAGVALAVYIFLQVV